MGRGIRRAALLLGVTSGSAHALMMQERIEVVPVARLVRALEVRLRAQPEDPVLWRTLGRVYHLAFVRRADDLDLSHEIVRHLDPDAPAGVLEDRLGAARQAPRDRDASREITARALAVVERLPPSEIDRLERGWGATPSAEAKGRASPPAGPRVTTQAERERVAWRVQQALDVLGWCLAPCASARDLEVLGLARRHFEEARRRDPSDPLAVLGLATLALQAQGALAQRTPGTADDLAQALSLEAAVGWLHEAWVLARAKRARLRAAGSATADEELDDTVALHHGRGRAQAVIDEVHELVDHLEGLAGLDEVAREASSRDLPLREVAAARASAPSGWWELVRNDPGGDLVSWVTPLAFLPRASASYEAIDAPDARVDFDLDGDGHVESGTWVRPGVGLLVWDPLRRGQVTSGRSLIGEASWWLLVGDGYAALAALDEDGDGEVAGAELEGLRVWFDDGDGVSREEEVVDLATLDIVGLRTDAGQAVGVLTHPAGIRLGDGRTWASFDWVGRRW